MKLSIKLRIAALAGSVGTTFALVYVLAGYAYPVPEAKALIAVAAGR